MSWIQSNLTLRLPLFAKNWTVGDSLWIGAGADKGFFLFQLNEKWIISNRLYSAFRTFSDKFEPVYKSINSVHYWASRSYYLWYNGQWIISKTAGYGTREEWVWNDPEDTSKGGYYSGDEWYSSASLPLPGNTAIFEPRGSLRGSVQNSYNSAKRLELEPLFHYWQHGGGGTAPAGEYFPMTGQDGSNKFVGIPQWVDSDGVTHTRSLTQDSTGHYTYGSILYDADTKQWKLDDFIGSEPSLTENVTFTNIQGYTKTISFNEYVIGDGTEFRYVGEAPIWL